MKLNDILNEASPNQQASLYNPNSKTYRGMKNKMPHLDDNDPIWSNADDLDAASDIEHDQDPDAEIDQSRLSKAVQKKLQSLSDVEKFVVVKTFGLDGDAQLDLSSIGNELGGRSRERVRQILAKALRKLKADNKHGDLSVYAESEVNESTPGQVIDRIIALFHGTAYGYALELMKEKGLSPADAARVVKGVDARILASIAVTNESQLNEGPGLIRGVLAALALAGGLHLTGPDAIEWADSLPDEAKAELQTIIDSGNTQALDKFKAKYVKESDEDPFADADDVSLDDVNFDDEEESDLGAEMAKYEESLNYIKKLAGL